MKETNIFQLIHANELVNNANIIRFSQRIENYIGISPILVLNELKLRGAQRQTVLAENLGYTPGAMTNIASKLVKEGYAERQYNADDRRNVLLAITNLGLKALEEAQRVGSQIQVELFSVLSEEEIEQYLSIQQKLLLTVSKNP
ncbi:MarR family winged helix-turn-helix transcriptional regulator [Rummeliibacillus pycnus]|uniref:MarR family winged helix-turn-helix transcriptional regulator n=1 Tax=Rummeliibacillus pycnus TaxID=101070 RepID=UPI000C9BAA4B|nr:MarR family transcriptional regulator [Rummeliibacillus pycnus]